MKKTIFDVDDIYTIRKQRETEYASMTPEDARRLFEQRANSEWEDILKYRRIINDWYKCPNILSPQPDKLPEPKYIHGSV